MNAEAAIEREAEIREQVNELEARIREVRDQLREARDNGDALAATDLTEALADLNEERDRLKAALKIAGQERVKATRAEVEAKARGEIEEIKAKLDTLFATPFDGVDELWEALVKFDVEGFKTIALARINQAQPLFKRLQGYQVHYRGAWGWEDVTGLITRINSVKTMLSKFKGG